MKLKAYRIEHDRGRHDGASLEAVDVFVLGVKAVAQRMSASHVGEKVSFSEMAPRITQAIGALASHPRLLAYM